MQISKIFKFDAAHKLNNYPGKCSQLHGHTYKLVVSCSGQPDAETGMIMDFKQIDKIVGDKIIEKLDHSYLNEIIENPTCENILLWIKEELKNSESLRIKKLVLYETEDSFCELEC